MGPICLFSSVSVIELIFDIVHELIVNERNC